MANDFSSDSRIVSVYKLENNGNDSKGANHLSSATSPTYSTDSPPEGSYWANFAKASSQYLTRADADLSSDFPFKNGTSNRTMSICFWIKKVDTVNVILCKGSSLYIYTGSNLVLMAASGYWDTGISMANNITYHVGIVIDYATGSFYARVYTLGTGVVREKYITGITSIVDVNNANWYLGFVAGAGGGYYNGLLDEVVVAKTAISYIDIDNIRAGTFGSIQSIRSDQIIGQVEYDVPPLIKSTQLIAQVEYEPVNTVKVYQSGLEAVTQYNIQPTVKVYQSGLEVVRKEVISFRPTSIDSLIIASTPIVGDLNLVETDTQDLNPENSTTYWDGQSFKPNKNLILSSVRFKLGRKNSQALTGNIYIKIYSHSGTYGNSSVPSETLLAISDVFDSSIIEDTATYVNFNFSGINQIDLVSGTAYCLVIASQADHSCLISYAGNNPHLGNYFYYSDSSWVANNTKDISFILFGTIGKIAKIDAVLFTQSEEGIKTLDIDSLVQSTFPLELITLDSYSETNTIDYLELYSGANLGIGQTFLATEYGILRTCKFYMKKIGNPSGSCYAKLYSMINNFGTTGKPTGNPLAISNALNNINIGTDPSLIEFIFSDLFQIVSGNYYVIVVEYEGGDSDNKLLVAYDSATLNHAGNAALLQ